MINELNKLAPYAVKITNRPCLPILANIRIGGGKAWCTNLETVAMIPIDIEGEFLVPFKLIKTILATKPESMTISNGENKTVILYDGKKASFNTSALEQFPIFPKDDYLSMGDWSGDIIQNLKGQIPFLSKDDLKPSLIGIYVKQENNELETCATDGHKLCLRENITADSGEFEGVLPSDWVKMLSKKALGLPLLVSVGSTHIKAETEGITLISRLVDEKYPDFKRVFPTDFEGLAEVNRSDFLAAIKEGSGFWNSTHKQGGIKYGENEINIIIEDVESGTEWETKIPSEQEGPEILIGYNIEYLMTLLKNMECENLEIHIPATAISATVFKEQSKGAKVSALLMPVRLQD